MATDLQSLQYVDHQVFNWYRQVLLFCSHVGVTQSCLPAFLPLFHVRSLLHLLPDMVFNPHLHCNSLCLCCSLIYALSFFCASNFSESSSLHWKYCMAYQACGVHVWCLCGLTWFLLKVRTKHLAVLPVLYLAIFQQCYKDNHLLQWPFHLEGSLQRKREKRGPNEWAEKLILIVLTWLWKCGLWAQTKEKCKVVFGTALALFVLSIFQPGLSQIGKLQKLSLLAFQSAMEGQRMTL